MRYALITLLLLVACQKQDNGGLQGYIEGEFVLLASPYAGQLQKLHVRRGDEVQAGRPMFALEQEAERAQRLEAEERLRSAQERLVNLQVPRRAPEIEALREQVRQAKAARELSVSQLKRQERLYKDGFIAQPQYDEARSALERDTARVAETEAQLKTGRMPIGRDPERKGAEREVEAARAVLAQAQWRMDQKSVASPASGRVQDTFFVEGEWVPAGRPVASLLPPGNVKARFFVDEKALGGLQPGRAVEIRCDGCPAPLAAKVTYISSQAEYTPPVLYSKESRGKLLFLVEARPSPEDGAKLRPGQPVDVILK
jgi:HlyD family secretion protein